MVRVAARVGVTLQRPPLATVTDCFTILTAPLTRCYPLLPALPRRPWGIQCRGHDDTAAVHVRGEHARLRCLAGQADGGRRAAGWVDGVLGKGSEQGVGCCLQMCSFIGAAAGAQAAAPPSHLHPHRCRCAAAVRIMEVRKAYANEDFEWVSGPTSCLLLAWHHADICLGRWQRRWGTCHACMRCSPHRHGRAHPSNDPRPLAWRCPSTQDNLRRVALEGLEQGNTQLLRQHASRRYTAMLERAGEVDD